MKLFVYGTLLSDCSNNYKLKDSKLLGKATTALSAYKMYSFGYHPAVVHGGDQKINGEVFEVDSTDVIESLDRMEGHPTVYRREKILIDLNGKEIECESYIYQHHTRRLELVESNDWKTYMSSRKF